MLYVFRRCFCADMKILNIKNIKNVDFVGLFRIYSLLFRTRYDIILYQYHLMAHVNIYYKELSL